MLLSGSFEKIPDLSIQAALGEIPVGFDELAIRAADSGYLQAIDNEKIDEVARQHKSSIAPPSIDQAVVKGGNLVMVWPRFVNQTYQ